MGSCKNLGRCMALAVLLGTTSAGCTVAVQPWTKPTAAGPPPDAGAAAFKAPMPSTYPANYPPNGPAPAGQPGAFPPGAYAATGYPPNAIAVNEYTAQLVKQLNEKDDQNKALSDQVQSLKRLSRERDENLQHASYEMDESSKQLKRTREEVRQFAGELEDMRERIRKLEEMRSSLKPLIDEIMLRLDREKELPMPLRAPAAKK